MADNYRAGERDTGVIDYKAALEKVKMEEWRQYRSGERGDVKKTTVEDVKQDIFQQTASLTSAKPPSSPPPPPPPQTQKIKSATPEIILFKDDSIPMEIMADLIFEDIGGQELLSVSRHDTISGDFITNTLIKNITSINQDLSPKRLLSLQNTSDKYFSNFGIKLENKIPFEGNGQNGSNVYVDQSTGDIIIELVNIEADEQAEVQIGIDGTIYTIIFDIGAS